MDAVVTCSFLWVVAIICYKIMKKIQPECSKLYLVYVVIICSAITAFLTWYVLKVRPVFQIMQ